MKIALRDDDTCFYTKPSELEEAFEGLNIPISLSVVPFTVFSHAGTYPYGKNCLNRQNNMRILQRILL